MKRIVLLRAVFLLSAVALAAQEYSARYALLIGNNTYPGSNLLTPVNDVEDMGEALKKCGFETTVLYDLDLAGTEQAVVQFIEKLKSDKNSEGFFWFAGHGTSFQGQNFLIPTNARVITLDDLTEQTYGLNRLLGQLRDAGNTVNVVVLDACRKASYLPGRQYETGLGRIDERDIPPSTCVIYSTEEFRIALDFALDGMSDGRHSPFAQAFLKEIERLDSFDNMLRAVTIETNRITDGRQTPRPYGQILRRNYSLNSRLPGEVPVEKGRLVISLSDPGFIIIDGKYYNIAGGADTITVELPTGRYDVIAQWKNDDSQSRKTVTVEAGASRVARFEWERKWNLKGMEKMGIDFGVMPLPDVMRFYIGMPYKDAFEPNKIFFLLPNSFSAHLLMHINFGSDFGMIMDISLLEASWNIPIQNRLILNFGIAGSLLCVINDETSIGDARIIMPSLGFPVNIRFRITPDWDIAVFSKFLFFWGDIPSSYTSLYQTLTVGFRWSS
jgi:hypothetical protein